MATKVTRKIFGELAELILTDKTLHKVTKYYSKHLVVSATFRATKREKKRGRQDGRSTRIEIVFKVGGPNYAQHKFIKQCIKAGVKFPVRKIQRQYLKGR
jgi:hypothetical protein